MRSRIFECEKRFLRFFEENVHWVVFALACLVGVVIRFPGCDFISGDYYWWLGPWYEEITQNGIYEQVGNYNLVYQFFILLMTKLPMPGLHAYKLLSSIFDFGLAFGAWWLTRTLVGKENKWAPLTALAVVLVSPAVVINSSVWAQCDSIFTFFVVLSLTCLVKEKYPWSMALLGVALAFKLQAIFFLPAYILVYFIRKRFSALNFLIIPVAMIATGLPTVFFGRNPLDVFSIYFNQVATYPYMSMNYPSFWQLVTDVNSYEYFMILNLPALGLTATVLVALALYFINKRISANGENAVYMAFILVYACVLLLPAMHERYSYSYEILAICIACNNRRTIPLCISLHLVTLASYTPFLFGTTPIPFTTLAVINIVTFVGYVYVLVKGMLNKESVAQTSEVDDTVDVAKSN